MMKLEMKLFLRKSEIHVTSSQMPSRNFLGTNDQL